MPAIPRREPQEGSLLLSQTVGRRAKDVRTLRGLSQATVAGRLEYLGYPMTRQSLSQLEGGSRNVTVDELIALAAALQTTLAFLLSPSPPGADKDTPRLDVGANVNPFPTEKAVRNFYGFEPAERWQAREYLAWKPNATYTDWASGTYTDEEHTGQDATVTPAPVTVRTTTLPTQGGEQ